VRVPVSEQVDLEAERILKFGYRMLYLEIGLFLIVSMFYWKFPFTLAFTGAILSLFYISRIWANYSGEEREVTESISVLYGDMYSWFISVK